MTDNQSDIKRQDSGLNVDESGNQSGENIQKGEKKRGRYTVKVIREKCIGAASCVAVAPATFKLDDENKAIILAQKMDSDEDLLLAAQSCPTAAIIVIDDETGEQIWPK